MGSWLRHKDWRGLMSESTGATGLEAAVSASSKVGPYLSHCADAA
jgi:hypothetical protein